MEHSQIPRIPRTPFSAQHLGKIQGKIFQYTTPDKELLEIVLEHNTHERMMGRFFSTHRPGKNYLKTFLYNCDTLEKGNGIGLKSELISMNNQLRDSIEFFLFGYFH